jgi:hypothetical protein
MIVASSSLVTPTNQNPGSYAIVESAGATGFTLGGSVPAVTQSPFADLYKEGSMYFPGVNTSNISVTLGSSYNWSLGLTAEAWVYYTSFAGSTIAAGSTVSAPCALGAFAPSITNSSAWALGADPNGKLTFYYYGYTGGTFQSANTNISLALNTWNHVAVSVPSGGPLSLYINGIQQTSNANNNGSLTAPSATTIALVGTPFSTYNYLGLGSYATAFTTGYIADARVTYGAALYTGSSFTVPSAPLTIAASGTTVMLARAGQNAPTVQNGALVFDRGLKQFMNFGPQTFNLYSQGFCCIFEFQFNGTTIKAYERIFCAAINSTESDYIQVMRNDVNAGIRFAVYIGSSLKFIVNSPSTLVQNQSYVCAAIYDPNVSSGTASIWINGIQVASTTGLNSAIAANPPVMNFTTIGAGPAAASSWNNANASIFTLAVYNRSLTDAEIYQSYLALSTPAPLKTLEVGDINGAPALSVAGDGKVFMDSIGLTSNVVPWPPAAMTGYVSQNCVASASTEFDATVQVWKAMGSVVSTYWQSTPTYTTTGYSGSAKTISVGGSTYNGEWMQLQVPTRVSLTSYTLKNNNINQFPLKGVLLGSNDGQNWFEIHIVNGVPASTTATFAATSILFSYFRFVTQFTNSINSNYLTLSLTLYGTADTAQPLEIAQPTTMKYPLIAPQLTGPQNAGVYVPQDFSSSALNIPAYVVSNTATTANTVAYSAMGPFANEGSLYFPGGTGAYVNLGQNVPIWTGGNQDATIEAWIYITQFAASGTTPLIIRAPNTTSGTAYSWGIFAYTGSLVFNVYNQAGPTVYQGIYTGTVPTNMWVHIAATYASGVVRVFLNGTVGGTAPTLSGVPFYSSSSITMIANWTSTAGVQFPGYISNLRIVSGAALYTSSFTPPTGPLQPIQGVTQAGRPYGTVLLLRNAPAPGRVLTQKFAGANSGQVLAFPPAAMTSYSTALNAGYGQGVYVASASSEFNGDSVSGAWRAFDKSSSSRYYSSTLYNATLYTGSVVTTDVNGTPYRGEWVQIQLPSSIVLLNYSITSDATSATPRLFYILGSSDGTSWYLVNNQNISTTISTSSFVVASSASFNYFRIVVSSIFSSSGLGVNITEWTLNGSIESVNITPDGRVGLGVVNPTRALEVAGDIVCSGTVSGGNPLMFRNALINGDMRIAQRGVSSTSTGAFVVDRFKINSSITTGVITYTQNTLTTSDTPYQYGFRYAANLVATTACSSYLYIQPMTILEGYSIQDFKWGTPFGAPATMSFWYRSNMPAGSTSHMSLRNYNVSTSYIAPFTTTGTWQFLTFTIPPPPSGTAFGTGGSGALELFISSLGTTQGTLGWSATTSTGYTGSFNWAATLNTYIQFTGVQLEKGTVATPFEVRPYATELALCQRYYYQFTATTTISTPFVVGHVRSGTAADVLYRLPVTMRGIPTLATSGSFLIQSTGSNWTVTSVTQQDPNTIDTLVMRFNASAATMTPGYAASVCTVAGTAGYYIAALAEL